ncbi:MAG TPA: nitrite/sulfite reductase [Caulobacteraceae bacterium]|jgi:sulfite reductase (NADPH) hemoprotein beta-component
MYRYDEFDARLVRERIAQFRDQIERRLDNRLTEDQFKPLRLMNGVYLQLHAYMLRVAIPYGELNAKQLRALAHIARTYDKGYGHFTTRSNIQFNWPALVDVPAILEALAEVEMHAIQTSGNCIRNVTTDPYAGVAADEVEDPRPWAELIRQWSTFHPEFSFLPRKFKIAVIGAAKDRAAMRTHDVGLQAVRDLNGSLGFRLFAGGGQGRTPYIGQEVSPFVPAASLFAYLTALLRVYNRHGRRDNIHKARIKILVASLGIEKFREEVEAEFDALPKASLDLPQGEAERIGAYFAPPPFATLSKNSDAFDTALFRDPDFAHWTHSNLKPHKQPGYSAVVVSLKPVGGVPGDATASQLDLVADLAERFSFGQARAAYDQNLILPHVRLDEAPGLFRALAEAGLATANSGLAGDIISCPGLDYCSLANARSIPVAQALSERLSDPDFQKRVGPVRINISGCINACGHHHVAHIGVLGVDKQGEEFYQITLGGSADETASIGTIVGKGLAGDAVAPAIERALNRYLDLRSDGEAFIDTLRRVGNEPFKEAIYAVA